MIVVSAEFAVSDSPGRSVNADYFGWGEPIFPPAHGTIVTAIDHHPDVTPPDPGAGSENNRVEIDLGGGFVARMFHAKQESLQVAEGQTVDTKACRSQTSETRASPHSHISTSRSRMAEPTGSSSNAS